MLAEKKQTILIWEALALLAGGQQVAYKIVETAKAYFKIVFVAPIEGELTRMVRQAGVTVELLPLGTYSIGRKNPADVIKFCIRFPFVLIAAYKLFKRYSPSVIYANASRVFIWSALLGQILRIPVIWHIHNIYQDVKTRKLISHVGKLPSVRKIVCVSNTVRKTLPSIGSKVKVIQNGVDLSIFKKKKAAGVLKQLGVKRDDEIISTISAIMPSKNQMLLVQAAPYILKSFENLCFLIVGGVRKEGKSYYIRLKEEIKKRGLDSYFIFTGYREDVPKILNETSINVITSEEAFPLILLESWAAEVPTVAPSLGVIPELIKHEENGLIFKKNDPQDLSDKIICLLQQPDLRNKITSNGINSAKVFSIQNFQKRILKTINGVLRNESCFG